MKNRREGKKQQAESSKRIINNFARVFFVLLLPVLAIGQTDTTSIVAPNMATTMRSNGKIYVVVAVLTIILAGLFLYLIRLDRKITKLEKE